MLHVAVSADCVGALMLKEYIDKKKRKIYPAYAAVQSGMGRFAVHWFTLPLLILFAFGCFALVTYLEGYKLFGLKVSCWVCQFYLCDYSVGFCSRLLVGAVITHFTDVVSTDLMNVIINTAVILSLILQSIAAGVILRVAMKRGSLLGCGITLLFLCTPMTVTENMRMPGQLDVYLLLIVLLWLFCYRTPAVYVVSLLVCAAGMAIHYEFLLMFLPPMMILLLYRAIAWEKRRARVCSAVTFAACAVVFVALMVWFLVLANKHLYLTDDEFYYNMLRRFRTDPLTRSVNISKMGNPILKEYFDSHIFGHTDYSAGIYGVDIQSFTNTNLLDYLKVEWMIAQNMKQDGWTKLLLPFLPYALIFCAVWGTCAVKEKGSKRFLYFCCAASLLILIPELLASSDVWRFISSTLISQYVMFFGIYSDKNSKLNEVLRI